MNYLLIAQRLLPRRFSKGPVSGPFRRARMAERRASNEQQAAPGLVEGAQVFPGHLRPGVAIDINKQVVALGVEAIGIRQLRGLQQVCLEAAATKPVRNPRRRNSRIAHIEREMRFAEHRYPVCKHFLVVCVNAQQWAGDQGEKQKCAR